MNLADMPWYPLPQDDLKIVVTGAAGGLGQAILAALSELNIQVVGIDKELYTTLENQKRITSNLLNIDEISSAITHAAEYMNGIDAIIGAAALVNSVHRASSFPSDVFHNDFEINLHSQFEIAKAAYPFLKLSKRSSIVFVSSQAGIDGLPGQVSYAASKAGLIGLTTALATEWVNDGIRVNAIAPGLFETPKVQSMSNSIRQRMLNTVPMNRVGSLAEIVGPILFLLSDASGYMTGRTIRVDGGAGLAISGLYSQ